MREGHLWPVLPWLPSCMYSFFQERLGQTAIVDRDVVQYYVHGTQIQHLITPFIKQIYDALQSTRLIPITLPLGGQKR